jgi:hypothetical protein
VARWTCRRAWLETDDQSLSAKLNGFITRCTQGEGGLVYRYISIVGAKFRRQASLFTAAGHFGFGFGQISQHDAIVLLTGSDDAVVLRPQGENWQLVGRAHVDGVEIGASWREKVEVCEMQTFVLV